MPRVRWPSGWPRWPIRGISAGRVTPSRVPPGGATIRRVIKDTCPGGLAGLLGHDPAGTDTLAIGGKSARGSRLGATPAAHLLAAMTGTGMTVTQLRVAEKTNEITCFAALLDPYDVQGVTVTGDALYTRRDHARFLVEEKKAHCAFTVKRNQKNLYEQLRTLPWQKAARHHRPDQPPASPERIAKILRAHWVIENRLHFVRDTAFREDASKIRTGHGTENMATLRSFAIISSGTAGHTNIAAGLRTTTLRPYERPLTVPGLNCAKNTINGLCNRPGGKPQRP